MHILSYRFTGNNMKSITFMRISTLLLFFIFGLNGIGMAGPMDTTDNSVQLSIREFLCTAFEDHSLSPQTERIRFLKETPGGISFIEDPEFRFTLDKFESNQQKYALRVKPRGWDELREEKTVQNARVQSGTIQLESLLHLAL